MVRFDPVAALLALPALTPAPGAAPLAEALAAKRRLPRAADAEEAAQLRLAALLVAHPPTMRLVDVALCDAAIRDALQHNEGLLHLHLPEFRRLRAGEWDTPAFTLLDAPVNAPAAMRLRHLQITDGRVPLSLDLLHYHAVHRLLLRLPSLAGTPASAQQPDLRALQVLRALQREQEAKETEPTNLGDVPADYPPCIRSWLAQLKSGIHLKHFARFNLMAFLGRLGWDSPRLAALFKGKDYDEQEIAFQAGHVPRGTGGTGYAPMGCEKLRSLALCPDAKCPGTTPLSLYAARRHGRASEPLKPPR